MKKVSDFELQKINGGITAWVAIGIGVVVTFVAGILDGIARPLKCHS